MDTTGIWALWPQTMWRKYKSNKIKSSVLLTTYYRKCFTVTMRSWIIHLMWYRKYIFHFMTWGINLRKSPFHTEIEEWHQLWGNNISNTVLTWRWKSWKLWLNGIHLGHQENNYPSMSQHWSGSLRVELLLVLFSLQKV